MWIGLIIISNRGTTKGREPGEDCFGTVGGNLDGEREGTTLTEKKELEGKS